MDDIVSITLLRHGVTQENKERRYLGWTDVQLHHEELAAYNNCQIDRTFDVIFSSDLQRCIETTQLILPYTSINKDSRLREYHFGLWEMKTYDDLKDELLYQQWLADPVQTTPPEGESFFQFKERVFQSWQQTIAVFTEMQNRHLLIVSHGGPIRLLLTELAPVHLQKTWWEWRVEHFSGYTLSFERNSLLKGGSRCTSLQVEPFMVKKSGS